MQKKNLHYKSCPIYEQNKVRVTHKKTQDEHHYELSATKLLTNKSGCRKKT